MYGSGERYGPRRHEVAFHDKQVFFGNGSSSHALGPRCSGLQSSSVLLANIRDFCSD